MNWASHHIEMLKRGETVQFRPRGNSMVGRISSGQLVTVEPVNDDTVVTAGKSVVLCKVNGKCLLHLVIAKDQDDRLQIGNNKGFINGWCSRSNVYGIVVKVED